MGTGLVIVTESDSQCEYSDTLVVNVGPVGIPDYAAEYEIQLFPNPTSGKCKLTWKGAGAVRSILVHDIAGQVISRYDDINGMEAELNILDIAAGLYFVELTGPEIRLSLPLIRQ